MKVLCLCSYPVEAACTRFRITQFVEPLAEKGIDITVQPFFNQEEFYSLYRNGRLLQKSIRLLNAAVKRLIFFFKKERFDALLIQREAMIIGPPIFEWFYKTIKNYPLILDLDDATYLSYISPTYGRMGSALKFFGKTDKLIKWSETVICGNRHVAEYVEGKGTNAVVVPTVVDTEKFYPVEKEDKKNLVLGWIGTHSTFPLLIEIFPVLQKLAQKYNFTLKIVGSGKHKVELERVNIENLDWKLEREIQDFQSIDIGLYPLEATESVSKEWLAGKSGFKSIQYMSVGIPFVVTPVGVCAEIGIENKTHFSAMTKDDWYISLAKLLESAELRGHMGQSGREYSLKHFTILQQSEKIADILFKAVANYKK